MSRPLDNKFYIWARLDEKVESFIFALQCLDTATVLAVLEFKDHHIFFESILRKAVDCWNYSADIGYRLSDIILDNLQTDTIDFLKRNGIVNLTDIDDTIISSSTDKKK